MRKTITYGKERERPLGEWNATRIPWNTRKYSNKQTSQYLGECLSRTFSIAWSWLWVRMLLENGQHVQPIRNERGVNADLYEYRSCSYHLMVNFERDLRQTSQNIHWIHQASTNIQKHNHSNGCDHIWSTNQLFSIAWEYVGEGWSFVICQGVGGYFNS